jgi:protease-4
MPAYRIGGNVSRLIIGIFIGLCFLPGIVAAEVDSDMEIFPQSAATINDISAGLVNPAGLAPENVMGFRYMHSYPESTFKGDNGLLFGMNGVMISIQWLKHTNNIFRRKILLAGGSRMFPNFYWGISYAKFTGNKTYYKGKNLWKTGIIYRPAPQLSLGLVVDDLLQPKFGDKRLERLYNPAIGIRPFGQKLTFSVDGYIRESESLSDMQSQVRVELLPKIGWALVAAYRNDGSIHAGVAYAFGQSQIGASSMSRERQFKGGTIYYNQGPVASPETRASRKSVGKITLDDSITEEVRGKSFFRPGQRSLLSVLQDIRQASQDKNISALYLDIQDCSFGFAAAQEIRSAIIKTKQSGKKVVAYLDEAGNLEYYVASAADDIYLKPTGSLELKGLKAEMMYLRGTLDKLGLEAEFIGIGEYKTAPEMLTRSTISPAESTQTNAMLDDFYNQFVSDIAESRGLTIEDASKLIDDGPYSPGRALSKGLVKSLVDDDDIAENPDKYFGAKYPFRNLSAETAKTKASNYWGDPARIAVIYATGEITGKKSKDRVFQGRSMGEKTVSEALAAARKDSDIKAVVLRINSPGGEVSATDGIYRELEKIKGKKPLIISMGNVGASGGYYLACIGDEVYMMPGTITGSIGIFTGKIVAKGLYEKIGVNKVVLTRGRHAGIRSDWLALDDEEKSLVHDAIKEFYDGFVEKVARWRRLSITEVDSIGQGRVWSGQRALDIGLGTVRGGFMDAIDMAIQRADIRTDQPIKLDIGPRYGYKFDMNYNPLDNGLAAAISDRIAEFGPLLNLDESAYYYRLPYNIEIK